MVFAVLEKSKSLGTFGLEALNISSRMKRAARKVKNVLEVNSLHHGSQFNTAARNKARTVQSFYNQSAIDIAAAKVNIISILI